MKTRSVWAALMVIILLAMAAGGHALTLLPTPTPDAVPGGTSDSGQPGRPGDAPAEGNAKSGLYDPSIFIIEASGTWRQELAPGYYADYECELYLDKVDANDSRDDSGLYTGVFWMKTTLDVADYLKDLLKNVPMQMDFNAGGEGVCDNLTVLLRAAYEKEAWEDYGLPDGQGGTVPPGEDMPVAKGSFIAQGMEAYLSVKGRGAQGVKVDYDDSKVSDAEVYYVIHVAPDASGTATQRQVTIHLSNPEGMAVTLQGVWRRIPGYPEDMLEHANTNPGRQVLEKYMQ